MTSIENNKKFRVILSGGGTGGHIYPALALADRLKAAYPQTEFLYIGTERGLESQVVPEHGLNFKAIPIEGFLREISFKGLKYNLNSIKLFLNGIKSANKIINEFQPDVVLGTGGYVSAPVLYAAARKNIPTVTHEQNSVVGITNKFLARFVDKIAICFEDARTQFAKSEEKVVFTGNPRAQEVAGVEGDKELQKLGLNMDIPSVVMFGGSRGAEKINQVFLESYKELTKKDYQVLFVSGNAHYEEINAKIRESYGESRFNNNIFIKPYILNMPQVFADIDLVVGRSGATTLAEITALGIPSILIPSPNVTEDHQTKNAMSLVDNGAAVLLKEDELTPSSLVSNLDDLMEKQDVRDRMASQSKLIGKPNAADDLIQVMLDAVREKKLRN